MDGSDRHQPQLETTTSGNADLRGYLGNMARTQAVERRCKVPGAAVVHHVHEVRYGLEHR